MALNSHHGTSESTLTFVYCFLSSFIGYIPVLPHYTIVDFTMAEEDHPAHLALTVSHQDPSCDQWLDSLDPAHREKVTLEDWTKTFHSTFRNGADRIKLDLAPNLVRGPTLMADAGNAGDAGPQDQGQGKL
jgi:hypothetical protein